MWFNNQNSDWVTLNQSLLFSLMYLTGLWVGMGDGGRTLSTLVEKLDTSK